MLYLKKIEKNHFKNFISGRLTDICQNPGELADEILSFTKGHPYYIEKWIKLNEASKNLIGFQIGNDGLSAQIALRDSTGQEFKTSHSLVINTVPDTLQNVVNERIRESEQQIRINLYDYRWP